MEKEKRKDLWWRMHSEALQLVFGFGIDFVLTLFFFFLHSSGFLILDVLYVFRDHGWAFSHT